MSSCQEDDESDGLDDDSDEDEDDDEEDDEPMEEEEEELEAEEVDQNFRLELMKVLQQQNALVGFQAFMSWSQQFVSTVQR